MGLSKTDRKRHDAALSAFDTYYSSASNWGDRWSTTLYPSLKEPKVSIALHNPFLPSPSSPSTSLPFPTAPLTVLPPSSSSSTPPPPTTTSQGLKSHYTLDPASLLPPLLLAPAPGSHVLDLCAAPGGKTLALAGQLFPGGGGASGGGSSSLTANEPDGARNARLRAVLAEYIPAGLAVKAVRHDGLVGVPPGPALDGGGAAAAAYDAVLLDAPCSSERHVVHAVGRAEKGGRACQELIGFRAGRAGKKGVVKVQAGLLLAALRAVKDGGRVVYSTCSVDRLENEGVVMGVLEKVAKEGFGVEIVDARTILEGVEEVSEECEVGRICLPDFKEGWGPIYFCVLKKTAVGGVGKE